MATDTLPHASIIGAAVPRIDGPLKTSGTARYAVDHDFPGSGARGCRAGTIGKGSIRSLDASAAEKMPGVLPGLPSRQHGEGLPHSFRM